MECIASFQSIIGAFLSIQPKLNGDNGDGDGEGDDSDGDNGDSDSIEST